METLNLTDKQRIEICDIVGGLLVSELDSKEVQSKVKQTVTDYLKSNMVNNYASDIIERIDWSVIVRLKSKHGSHQDNLLDLNVLADNKAKGDFTIVQRKKKSEIIEEDHHEVKIPPDVSDEEKKALDQTGDDATSGW